MKKFLSVILATLMVATTFFTLPFNAFAITQSEANNAKNITASSTKYVEENVTPQDSNYVYYKITVEETGVYSLYSSSSADTYGELYSADFNEIDYDDDDGEGSNFKIVSQLVKGNIYYLGVKYYSSSYVGQAFNITIERDNDSVVLDGIMYTKYTEKSENSDDVTYYKVTRNFLTAPTKVTIRNEVNGYPVKRIGQESFYNCEYITSLTIQDGIEIIEEDAFCGCLNLASINLCDSITELRYDAFYGIND